MTDPRPGQRQLWKAQTATVGSFGVLRPIPHGPIEAVGPFVFLDHFGPTTAATGKLPAHPHAGIEVMTYLLEGANEHTDSLGNVGQIGPGGAQWMRAGRGVLHAERNLLEDGGTMHGLQIWARLPIAEQDAEPDYRAIAADEMPAWSRDGAEVRLLAGSLEGHEGPIPLGLPALMAHVVLAPVASIELELPGADREAGVYGIEGTTTLDGGDALVRGTMARLADVEAGVQLACDGDAPAEVLLVGGEPAPRPLHFGGPFVLDSPQALERAYRRYANGEMGTLDGTPF
ncbi:MAG: pirin family protein [Planctomycetota bacterium]